MYNPPTKLNFYYTAKDNQPLSDKELQEYIDSCKDAYDRGYLEASQDMVKNSQSDDEEYVNWYNKGYESCLNKNARK